MSWLRITVRDLEDGSEEVVEIQDDYVLITQGVCYLDALNAYGNGTHQLTVKKSIGQKRESTVGKCKTCLKPNEEHDVDSDHRFEEA